VANHAAEILGGKNISYPALAAHMPPGGTFSDADFDKDTGKLISVIYAVGGQRYHWHQKRLIKWQAL